MFPLAQILVPVVIVILIVVVGSLTAPLWMKAVRNLGKLMMNQLNEGAKTFDKKETSNEEKKDA